MNIDSPTLPPVPPSAGTPAPCAPRAKAGNPTTATAHGSAVTQLRSTHGDFDAARVAEIRERIQSGSYPVNLERVADGLLTHLNQLSTRT